MKIGGSSFVYDPSDMSEILKQQKVASAVKTYSSRAYFNWGLAYPLQITLSWDYMKASEFDDLVALANSVDTGTILFEPDDGSGTSFDVWMGTPKGKYCNQAMEIHRKDVELVLYIKGVHA